MSETTKTEEQQALEAVEKYAYERYEDLNTASVGGWSEDELERVKTEGGRLVFTVDNVHVDGKEEEDGVTYWYVEATIEYQVEEGEPIEGDTDIYECYRNGSTWEVRRTMQRRSARHE